MEPFQPYGVSHWVTLVVLGVGLYLAVVLGRRDHDGRISRAFAVLIPCVVVPTQVLTFVRRGTDLEATLPLQLCDLAWMTAIWALWSHHRLPVALIYFWGLALSTQAALTPALREGFPEPAFFAFWAQHHFIVWAAVFLTWGRRLRPTWWSYWVTIAVTLAWMVSVYVINTALGTNYGFVNRKPSTPSVLDLFGPWPVYLFVEIVIVAAAWALMTWPWTRAAARRASQAAAEQR